MTTYNSLIHEFEVQKLQKAIRVWQIKMQMTFQKLSEDPTIGDSKKFYAILTEILEQLEARMKETLNTETGVELSTQDAENCYRLLGAYRGVSEAMGDYAGSTDVVHWSRWKEEKFTV